jgi:hypothetical protein
MVVMLFTNPLDFQDSVISIKCDISSEALQSMTDMSLVTLKKIPKEFAILATMANQTRLSNQSLGIGGVILRFFTMFAWPSTCNMISVTGLSTGQFTRADYFP